MDDKQALVIKYGDEFSREFNSYSELYSWLNEEMNFWCEISQHLSSYVVYVRQIRDLLIPSSEFHPNYNKCDDVRKTKNLNARLSTSYFPNYFHPQAKEAEFLKKIREDEAKT